MSFSLLKPGMQLAQAGNVVILMCADENDAIALHEALKALDQGEFEGYTLHTSESTSTLCQGDDA